MFDVSLPISQMEQYVANVNKNLKKHWNDFNFIVWGHLADGNLHLVAGVGDLENETVKKIENSVYDPLELIGGSVSAEHGIGIEKKYLDQIKYYSNSLENYPDFFSISDYAENIFTYTERYRGLIENEIFEGNYIFASKVLIPVFIYGFDIPGRIKSLLGKTANLAFRLETKTSNESFGTEKLKIIETCYT